MKKHIIPLLLSLCILASLLLPVAADDLPAWNEAYGQEVLTNQNLSKYAIRTVGATYALRDLDNDGIPELIAGDGWESGTYGHGYVFTYRSGDMQFLGYTDCYGGVFGAHLVQNYPGFCTCVWTREYSGSDMLLHYYYHYVTGGELKSLEVATGAGNHFTRVTSNQALYQAVVNSYTGATDMLELYKIGDIKVMGWNAFVSKYYPSVAGFYDVNPSAWYAADVEYCAANNLMNGTGDGVFSPGGTATRAQIVTILYRLSGSPAVGSSGFADVPAGTWYSDAVAWARQNAIVNGTGNNRFSPTNPVTREQMATILFNYARFRDLDTDIQAVITGYSDATAVSSYAVEAMRWANAAGIITGNNKNMLNPRAHATRAEAAAILHRFCENMIK